MFKNKEAVITITAQAVQLIAGLILIKLISTELSKDSYAVYALLLSIVAFFNTFPFTSLSEGYMRYVSIYSDKNRLQYFYILTLTITLTLLFSYFLIAFFAKNFIFDGTVWDEHFYAISGLVFTEIIKMTYRRFENAARNRVGFANSIIIEFFLKIAILLLALDFWTIELKTIIFTFTIANFFSICLLLRYSLVTNWKISKRFNKVVFIRLFSFSAPLIIWGLFGWIRDMSGRWIIDIYTTKEQVAAFSLMASIAMIGPTAVQSIIGAYLIPVVYEKENHQHGYTRKVLLRLIPTLLVGLLVATGILYFIKHWVVLFISDPKYISDSWMLPIMFFSYGMFVISMMSSYEIFAHKQTKLMLWPNIISGLVSLILGALFTHYFGLTGMVTAFVVAYLSYALITFRISWTFKIS